MARLNLKQMVLAMCCFLAVAILVVDVSFNSSYSTFGRSVPDTLEELKQMEEKVRWYENTLSEKNFIISAVNKRLVNGSANASAIGQSYSSSRQTNQIPTVTAFTAGTFNNKTLLTIGIPTVYRLNGSYLTATLESLFTSMSDREMAHCTVVVLVAEPSMPAFYLAVAEELTVKFPTEMATMLQVIVPPAAWYPDLDHLPQRWGDPPFRAKWRTKQNLDYSFLMEYCSHVGKYYLQLEDDVISTPNFVSKIISAAESTTEWGIIHFSPLGFIGKLFRTTKLQSFTKFLLLFAKDKPVDWLMSDYFRVEGCQSVSLQNCGQLKKSNKFYKPSLFQHMGFYSSLPGKIQKLKDKGFGKSKPVITKAISWAKLGGSDTPQNPPATFNITLKQYGDYSFTTMYTLGMGVYWSLGPKAGDYIAINFKIPVRLKRYKVVSGDPQHPTDRISNASVAVQPQDKSLLPRSTIHQPMIGPYLVVGSFSDQKLEGTVFSVSQGDIPSSLGLISSVKITCNTQSSNWIIIQMIQLEKA